MAFRLAAQTTAAAFAVGFSLAGPQALAIAVADSSHTNDSARTNTAAASSDPGTSPGAGRVSAPQGSRSARGPAVAGPPATTASRGGRIPGAAHPVSTPARAKAADPAAGQAVGSRATSTTATTGPGTPVDPHTGTGAVPAAAPAVAAAQPGMDSNTPAQQLPLPVSTAVAAPAASSAQTVNVGVKPVQQLLNTIGRWLADLPATPVTDFLSGSLWLVRRTLTAVSSFVNSWGPAACACAGKDPAAGDFTGQVLTVTNSVDGAAGSLRDVLSKASSGDVIRFAPALRHAKLVLTEGALDINVSVRIEGTGQTLDAKGLSRIMLLDQPGTSIALDSLTFANGVAPGDPSRATTGGAILADGVTLEICGSTFTGNTATAAGPAESGSSSAQYGTGGAVAAYDSTVSILDSAFTSNTAAGAGNNIDQQASGGLGGAIFAENSAITLARSQFTDNSAVGGSAATPIAEFPTSDGGWGAGGAIFSSGGPLSATDVTFTHNSATGGNGLDGSASNPYGNGIGAGGNASGGALWVQGQGQNPDYAVPLQLQEVRFLANTATGGSAGEQGSALLAAKQGGRSIGGALGVVDWVAVSMADVTFDNNLAQGGGAGPNAPGAGSNTGTGGVGEAGAFFLESTASVDASQLSVRDNTARGGQGGSSRPVRAHRPPGEHPGFRDRRQPCPRRPTGPGSGTGRRSRSRRDCPGRWPGHAVVIQDPADRSPVHRQFRDRQPGQIRRRRRVGEPVRVQPRPTSARICSF